MEPFRPKQFFRPPSSPSNPWYRERTEDRDLTCWSTASQDDMAPVASITAVRASKLLPGFAVKAAHPIASASPSDKHSAMIHKMPFQFFLREWLLPGGFLVLVAVCTAD